jgi:3'-phosphoadenosine 5'-phosphosulfate sulfotransferase (PAPS reductase)/FAD synthetase
MNVFTKEDLKRFQAESLDDKFQRTLAKVSEWYSRWNNEVYVSFSGGKDSTVLADICARWCKVANTPLYLAFVNTGLEYPEIRKHVEFFAQWLRDKYEIEVVLDILRPEMRFDEVIKKYGYPIISKEVSECVSQGRNALERDDGTSNYRLLKLQGKALDKEGRPSLFNRQKYEPLLYTDFLCSHQCCNVMKKKPAKQYAKQTGRKPITAQMAEESTLRTQQWLKNGCNGFNMASPISNPMSFWTEQDVLKYIQEENLPIAPVYGEIVEKGNKLATTGCERTGCMFCAFGCHLEKSPSRFVRLKETHPRQYEYCINGGGYSWTAKIKGAKRWRVFDFVKENNEKMTPEEIEEFVVAHRNDEKYKFTKVWMPNKQGLGLGHVFNELNKLYGDDFITYSGGDTDERT